MAEGIKIATIASGESLSSAVDCGELRPFAIQMPAAWDAAGLTFQKSADGITYSDVYAPAGTEYSLSAAASEWINLNPQDFADARYLKVRSGTSGTPVNQLADRALSVVIHDLRTTSALLQVVSGASSRTLYDKLTEAVSVKDRGAKGDGNIVRDGAIANGTPTLTSASALFASGDVGKTIIVSAAGVAGASLVTTIAAYVSATEVTLTDNASSDSAAALVAWGTDDTDAFNNWFATVPATTDPNASPALLIPSGTYLITDTLAPPNSASGYSVIGQGRAASRLVWAGTSGKDVLTLTNARHVHLADFGIWGHSISSHRPACGIRIRKLAGQVGSAATGANMLENLFLGGYDADAMTGGIIVSGVPDTNNDQNNFRAVYVRNVTNDGISIEQANSLWNSATDCIFEECARSGINNVGAAGAMGGGINAVNGRFAGCGCCYRLGQSHHSMTFVGTMAEDVDAFLLTPSSIDGTKNGGLRNIFSFFGGGIEANDGTVLQFDGNTYARLDLHGLHISSPSGFTASFPTAAATVNFIGGEGVVAIYSYNCLLNFIGYHNLVGAPTYTDLGSGQITLVRSDIGANAGKQYLEALYPAGGNLSYTTADTKTDGTRSQQGALTVNGVKCWGAVQGSGTALQLKATGAITVPDDGSTLTLTSAQYECPIIRLSGAIGADRNVVFPNTAATIMGFWVVVNECTNAHNVLCKTAAGAAVTIQNGKTAIIRTNGTDAVRVTADV